MILKKKNRYKPFYKKLLNLRKIILNKNKIKKFRKKKWDFINSKLRSKFIQRRNKFKFFDHHLNVISTWFVYKMKFEFQNNLKIKQRFCMLYGRRLTLKNLKKNAALSYKSSIQNYKSFNSKLYFLNRYEYRLDSVLLRSHFVKSIRSAQNLILNGQILVNKKKIKIKSYILNKNDIVEICKKSKPYVLYNLKHSDLWPIPPNNLFVNYRNLQIIIMKDLKDYNFFSPINFNLNLNKLVRNLKY